VGGTLSWASRGRNGRYYYRSVREPGGRVGRIYLGTGEVAEQAARDVTDRKSRRQRVLAEMLGLLQETTAVEQLTATLDEGLELLTAASLLVTGCHEHRGQWRRQRIGDRHERR
jgi:hypothetical protein